eukprot:1815905-Pyramimonas_sp.AAC.1
MEVADVRPLGGDEGASASSTCSTTHIAACRCPDGPAGPGPPRRLHFDLSQSAWPLGKRPAVFTRGALDPCCGSYARIAAVR